MPHQLIKITSQQIEKTSSSLCLNVLNFYLFTMGSIPTYDRGDSSQLNTNHSA